MMEAVMVKAVSACSNMLSVANLVHSPSCRGNGIPVIPSRIDLLPADWSPHTTSCGKAMWSLIPLLRTPEIRASRDDDLAVFSSPRRSSSCMPLWGSRTPMLKRLQDEDVVEVVYSMQVLTWLEFYATPWCIRTMVDVRDNCDKVVMADCRAKELGFGSFDHGKRPGVPCPKITRYHTGRCEFFQCRISTMVRIGFVQASFAVLSGLRKVTRAHECLGLTVFETVRYSTRAVHAMILALLFADFLEPW